MAAEKHSIGDAVYPKLLTSAHVIQETMWSFWTTLYRPKQNARLIFSLDF